MKISNALKVFMLVTLLSCSQDGVLGKLGLYGGRNLKGIEVTPQPIPPKVAEVDISFCSIEPEKVSDQLRVVFAIDTTGSNVIPDCGANQPGCPTDPDKMKRYTPLEEYIANRRTIPNFNSDNEKYAIYQWSYQNDVWNGGSSEDNNRFLDIDTFEGILPGVRNLADVDGTPYVATLNRIRDEVEAEARAMKIAYEEEKLNNPNAEIGCFDSVNVFISDGFPTRLNEDTPENIKTATERIVELDQHPEFGAFICSVTVNSAFYNSVELQVAIDRLKIIANAGNGEFFNFLGNDPIDYNQVTSVNTKKVPIEFSQIIVLNENIVWDKNLKKYVADLDRDRLADYLELEKCVPTSMSEVIDLPYRNDFFDCDKNDMMDGFESMIDGDNNQCKDPDCDPEQARKTNCKLDGKLQDKDKDELLDCLEKDVGSQINIFDSYQSDIPDYIKWRHQYKMAVDTQDFVPVSSSTKDSDGDGIADYDEIRINTPWQIHNDFLGENVKPFKYELVDTFFNRDKDQMCFQYKIHDITLASPEDMISVYLVDEEIIKPGRKAYRVVKKRMKDMKVKFTIEEFSSEEALKSVR